MRGAIFNILPQLTTAQAAKHNKDLFRKSVMLRPRDCKNTKTAENDLRFLYFCDFSVKSNREIRRDFLIKRVLGQLYRIHNLAIKSIHDRMYALYSRRILNFSRQISLNDL